VGAWDKAGILDGKYDRSRRKREFKRLQLGKWKVPEETPPLSKHMATSSRTGFDRIFAKLKLGYYGC
jgi:hypothetical protein